MKVNDELINNLAHLSRLEFNNEERNDIKKDLERMISFIEKLNELDTTGIEPLLHISANINMLREDEVKGSISRDEAFVNTPLHTEEFFQVPKVIKR